MMYDHEVSTHNCPDNPLNLAIATSQLWIDENSVMRVECPQIRGNPKLSCLGLGSITLCPGVANSGAFSCNKPYIQLPVDHIRDHQPR